jgi:tRNA(Ile2) C34 agmatinyltransferase TiaS
MPIYDRDYYKEFRRKLLEKKPQSVAKETVYKIPAEKPEEPKEPMCFSCRVTMIKIPGKNNEGYYYKCPKCKREF